MFFTNIDLILFILISSFTQIKANFENDLSFVTTDQFIRYYGYLAEEHTVTTEDGYILKIFRCNSKRFATKKKKPLIIQHGLVSSSDEFTTNIPSQAIAYVFADAGYDVFLPNSRGNYYSHRHVSKNPDNPSSGFWNYSWYEMAIYDHPAVIDYILKETGNEKVYYLGYSQGTTTLMVLLSERPEYNKKIRVASLMAPVGYVSSLSFPKLLLRIVQKLLAPLQNTEILPRSVGHRAGLLCSRNLTYCNEIVNFLNGPSQNQRNDTMLPIFVSRLFSGSSVNQILHYLQEINYSYFGKYMHGSEVPPDFDLSRINIPLSLHYSTVDKLANAPDTRKLISKLSNKVLFAQEIHVQFNHIDFAWSKNAASLIYTKILQFFDQY